MMYLQKEYIMSFDIGSLIVCNPEIRRGRPCIAGTGITVHRIAVWYKLGYGPEEIAGRYEHLNATQVYAALAYYHASRDEIEKELAEDEAEADRIEQEYLKNRRAA
jgi:uncharacterized protein (DUF433 family)